MHIAQFSWTSVMNQSKDLLKTRFLGKAEWLRDGT